MGSGKLLGSGKMDNLYREEILDHYKNPHNFGDLADPTVVHEESNPLCGDQINLQLKIDQSKVVAARFRGQGCAVSTASASILTDHIQGQNLDRLRQIKGEDILDLLGLENLSPARLKCAFLSWEALKHSLEKYHRANQGGGGA